MKNIKYIFCLLSLFLFYSCVQPSEEESIPYIPKLVVNGFISEGTSVKNIYIGRTMPVSVKIDPSFTELPDVLAYIIYKGQLYPLSYTKNSLYKNDTLQIIRGETYTLIASWQNLSINAQTTIPEIGTIPPFRLLTSSSQNGTVHYLQSSIIPKSDEIYAATWEMVYLSGAPFDVSPVFSTVSGKDQTGTVLCRTADIPENYLTLTNINPKAHVYVFDRQYLDFYSSQNLNQASDAIFGQTGSEIKWNIKGDGIGLFIGRIDTLILK